MEEQKDWAEKQIESWITEARQQNVELRLHNIVEESLSSSASAIEKIAAQEKVGLIGVVSHVGPLEGLALGSVTQDLMSAQKFNLWICGPKFHHNGAGGL